MKNLIPQFSLAVVALFILTFLMSYTRPAIEEPKQYIVVFDRGHDKPEAKVNEKLAEGWHLQGGVALYGMDYVQALAK